MIKQWTICAISIGLIVSGTNQTILNESSYDTKSKTYTEKNKAKKAIHTVYTDYGKCFKR